MILTGDCVEVMATLPENSVDAIVTDPPYGLEFMGKEWDKLAKILPASEGYSRPGSRAKTSPMETWGNRPSGYVAGPPMQQFHARWATEALRVLKPGHYLLAFGGTRTVHRLTVALEDSGWIIRDMLIWAYASGFPKGRAQLKPAYEPIVLAKKPGPLVPLGIDAARIGTDTERGERYNGKAPGGGGRDGILKNPGFPEPWETPKGRWPSNLILTSPLFDGDTPGVVGGGKTTTSLRGPKAGQNGGSKFGPVYGDGMPMKGYPPGTTHGDTGTYSRFFMLSDGKIGTCVQCGAPLAEPSSSSSSPASDGSIAPADANAPASPKSDRGASDAGSPLRRWSTAGAPSPAPTWTSPDATESTPKARRTTPGTENVSLPSARPSTTSPSHSPGSPPSGASQSPNPASSAEASATSSGTTTTTPSRLMCASCAALATSQSIPDESSDGTRASPAELGTYPRFLVIPKSSRSDREPNAYGRMVGGLEETERQPNGVERHKSNLTRKDGAQATRLPRVNQHPTTKPLALMRHLVRLVTPSGGTVLDPFAGSGTTGLACELEGFDYTLIEREPEYVKIIEARLAGVQRGLGLDVAAPAPKAGKSKGGGAIHGRPVTGYGGHWADERHFDGYQDEGTPSRFFMLPRDPLDDESA